MSDRRVLQEGRIARGKRWRCCGAAQAGKQRLRHRAILPTLGVVRRQLCACTAGVRAVVEPPDDTRAYSEEAATVVAASFLAQHADHWLTFLFPPEVDVLYCFLELVERSHGGVLEEFSLALSIPDYPVVFGQNLDLDPELGRLTDGLEASFGYLGSQRVEFVRDFRVGILEVCPTLRAC
jgi:hypothetical protein